MPYVKLSKTVDGWGPAWDAGQTVFVGEQVARDLLKEQFGELVLVPTEADNLAAPAPAADVQTLSETVEALPGAQPAEPQAAAAEPAVTVVEAAPAATDTPAAPAAPAA